MIKNQSSTVEKTSPVDDALRLAEKGWPVLPVHSPKLEGGCTCGNEDCSSMGKHPRTSNGFHNATTDPDQIAEWFEKWPEANLGVRTGKESGIVALDVDLKHDGVHNLTLLEQEHDPLPQTVEVVTGSGGRHIYFSYPDCDFEAVNEIAKGVEVKADGRYLVAPPSIHASGNRYKWKEGHEPWSMELAPLPDWLLQLADKNNNRQQTTGLVIRTPQVIAKNEIIFSNIAPCINSLAKPLGQLVLQALDKVTTGEGRNNAGFALACQVRDAGFTHEAAKQVIAVYQAQVSSKDHDYTIKEAMESMDQAYSRSMRSYRSTNPTRIQTNMTPPGEPELRDWWLQDNPNTAYSGGHWKRYQDGIWLPAEEDAIKKEIMLLLQEAECQGIKVTSGKVDSVYGLAKLQVAVSPEVWDADPDILVCSNGTLRISTGELLAHSPYYFATTAVPFPYEPNAKAPTWEKCLTRLSKPVVDFLQEFFGYCLTPDTKHEIALWFYGPPGSGKSTILEGPMAMLGQKCGILGLRQITETRFGLSAIIGRTLVIANEQPGAYIKSTDTLKSIISGEKVTIEDKYSKPYDYKPKCKIAWAMNEKPKVGDPGDGLFRRVKIVEFPSLAEVDRDPKIKDLLKAEGSGILSWALEGLKRLNKRGGFQIVDYV